MSRRANLLSIVVGLALLIGAPAIWWAQQPTQTVGDFDALGVPSGEDATPTDTATRADDPTATDDDRSESDGSAVTDEAIDADATNGTTATAEPGDATTADDAPADVPFDVDDDTSPITGPLENLTAPTRISIPALGVDSAIDPVGVEPNGEMEIPEDIRRIGWFKPGMIPGRNGTAVLSGHVDSRTQGRGAFYRLRELGVDDTVTITHDDGEQRTWRVVARTSYGKDALPVEDIFVRSGEPRLALITCDGSFDASTRSYLDNVVVYAVPT